jgi:hypothetical protein
LRQTAKEPGGPGALSKEMTTPSWVRWYMGVLHDTAQPRDEDAVERVGLRRLVLGHRTPGSGWGTVPWSFEAGLLALCALLSFAAGLWWLGLALLPLVAHAGAKTIGTFREGHLF